MNTRGKMYLSAVAVITATVTVGFVAQRGFAWTNPGNNPPFANPVISASGSNVGIGTGAPGYKLDVQGGGFNVNNGGSHFTYNGGADITFAYPSRGAGGRALVAENGNALTINYGGDFTGGTNIGSNLAVTGTITSQGKAICLADGTNCQSTTSYWNGNGTNIYNNNSGNVGVGTASPAAKLDVAGNLLSSSARLSTSADLNGLTRWGINDVYTPANGVSGQTWHNVMTVPSADTNYISQLNFGMTENYPNMWLRTKAAGTWGSWVKFIHDDGSGNVGIGVTAPGTATKLQVAGRGLFTGGSYDPGDGSPAGVSVSFDGTAGHIEAIQTGVAGKPLELQHYGNLGIGTASPGVKLEVAGSVRGNQAGALRIDTGNGYVDIGPQNASWSHFQTDRPNFYFNKGVYIDGGLGGYSGATGGTYGSLSVYGSKNGWAGFNFPGNGTLMMNGGTSGFYNAADNGWRWNVSDTGLEQNYGGVNYIQANPYLSASSYMIIPGGAYFSSGTVYAEAAIQARGGIHDDAHTNLSILGGTSGNTNFSGGICLGGVCRTSWSQTGIICALSTGMSIDQLCKNSFGTSAYATGLTGYSGGSCVSTYTGSQVSWGATTRTVTAIGTAVQCVW